MSPLSFLVLLILSTSIVLCTAQPVLKIGWVRPLCGEALAYYFDQEEALLFWANYTNENGGVNVNGTAHQVQMVLYNNANDVELTGILYDRLARVDQVHVFIGSEGNTALACYEVAHRYGIPVLSASDFTYYSQFGAPNGTYDGWLFSFVPDPLRIFEPCLQVVARHGVTTMSTGFTVGMQASGFDLLHQYAAAKYNISVVPPHDYIADNMSNIDDLIEIWKAEGTQAWSGGSVYPDVNAEIAHRIRYNKYEPGLIMNWISTVEPPYREPAVWKVAGVIGPDIWDSSLHFDDPYFGNSENLLLLYNTRVGKSPGALALLSLFSLVSLQIAIERAGSLDPYDIRDALFNLNDSTFFGRANFSNALQRTDLGYYCFQIEPDGSMRAISDNAPRQSDLIYPALVTYPDGFFPPPPSTRARKLAIGLGVGLGILLLVLIIAGAIGIKKTYEVVFIPRSETDGDHW